MKTRTIVLGAVLAGAAIAVGLVPASSRAAYPAGRFTVATLTARDTTTGLMWQRGFQPAQFGGLGANSATGYCEALTLDGYSDWRLPSAKELLTLFDPYELSSRIDTSVFTPTGAPFHSSSFFPNNPTYVYTVSYTVTATLSYGQNNFGFNARCVRSIPNDGGS